MEIRSLKLQYGVEGDKEKPGHCIPRGCALACMVNSEIGAVLAVVRRNVRWGGRYMADDDQLEHSLVQSLKILRKQIFLWDNQWHTVNPSIYLRPFLDVIRSDEIGAPITGVALSSVYKILTLGILDPNTINVGEAMHLIVDAVTGCRFEVTDPASEEVVLMKILQVLLACMKCKASILLNNQHVCTIVYTCFRIVHQAGTKGELLQRIARTTMHELIRCIFSRLPYIHVEKPSDGGGPSSQTEVGGVHSEYTFEVKQSASANGSFKHASISVGSEWSLPAASAASDGSIDETVNDMQQIMREPYGVPCMVEVFHFLCSLLNIAEQMEMSPRSNQTEFDEDVPLFALGLINSAIELAGSTIKHHPKLLALIQDDLFHNLMQFGMSLSPLILSMVCNIILNLYLHLYDELKLQLEAFFSCLTWRLTHSRHGSASYQQHEVLMEALVDFCRQKTFMAEMYTNFDCDISFSNVFEDLANLLSKSSFPVNSPLSSMHILALEGLLAVVQGLAERTGNALPIKDQTLFGLADYTPFWTVKCENHTDPNCWVEFVRQKKHLKRVLMTSADHFNRDPKKGLEFLQGMHLLPDKLDPSSVACFLRYTPGLDKNVVGDLLGSHDEFWVQVLHEFARTFNFQDRSLDTALRLFLESFRLPGESQKIQRVLEAFSERYYEQSPHILANKDAALLLSYSIIMLNTDRHNVQVKKKMTEDDFIRNNRRINGGNDLPREFLSELYHSICKNEIRMTPGQGADFAEVTSSRWINLLHKSQGATPFITYDARPFLDHDMFAILSGPTLAALSVVYDHAEHEDVYQMCNDGFLAVAKISASHHFDEVLDDLVVSLCKFTTLLNPSQPEELILTFTDDAKAMMATVTVFTIANTYGDSIHTGWRSILECILTLHKLGLVPALVGRDSTGENELFSDSMPGKPVKNSISVSHVPAKSVITVQRSSGLMSRFSRLLSFDAEEPSLEPSDEEVEARQRAHETIKKCRINGIFTESKFLQSNSLLHLVQALIWVSGKSQKGKYLSHEDEDASVFCLELLITITLYNRDRIVLLWPSVHEHIAGIVQSTAMPSALVERAVFGLLHICRRLLPYKENLGDDLLRSLQLVLKLDARVADAYCEHITQEVTDLVKTNAGCIRSQMGWRTITSLLSITARHPEASEVGFEALAFVMYDGAHLSPDNCILFIDASRQFAESRVGPSERSIHALDLMAGCLTCLKKWEVSPQEIGEIWMRLVRGLRKVSLDRREEVRNHAVLSLQRCTTGCEGFPIPPLIWMQCFDEVIFTMLDDMLEVTQGQSSKDYRNMEGTLIHAVKLSSKVFLQLVNDLSPTESFSRVWLGMLGRMEKYTKVKIRGKKSEKLQELIPELLKNTLLVMKTKGVLVKPSSATGSDSLWELTWPHVSNIASSLKSQVFPDQEPDNQWKETANSASPESGTGFIES
ncbi:ARF guanine-nucleotide exchange factor GNOM-like [Macadamia integrifolia]|uniref:ARF guanine-nucleotide exchange factor GNOM-like n=1 Tax=Macadamia integrifolia TaxID=60698 RepID=UPI001C4E525E|nr:ARF guanine-nucleotide exchange factor GNOM-like [Macadamia integrifolia]XP_042487170.1 ARF guanine-nucleotide exchange factor GNOM-like [Macadamia integrifolia]XP_042487171.1 ARF guanine-nucleotide exchange factor GNOM-like [Macadamia integrifolia]